MPDPDPHLPRYAVVGRVNKGKSSILATLVEEADNARIRISATPGETTRCQSIPLVLRGETLIEFIDTPGFNRARQALDWMEKRHRKTPDAPRIETIRLFVETHKGKRRFEDECLLLEPILEGAGILYVADASKPFRPDFNAEMEILRWTGRPRMALVNHISTDTNHTAEWRQHLGEYFNLTRDFNAHTARFSERIRLLTSLLEIEEPRHPNIQKTIDILSQEWDHRRGQAADIIIDLIDRIMTYRASKTLSQEDAQRDYKREEVSKQLIEVYMKKIREIESTFHDRLVRLYKHIEYESRSTDDFDSFARDLFAKETFAAFGLNRKQLTVASSGAGAAAGAAVDMAVGGQSLGAGALIGGILGAAASFLSGKDLANIKVTNPLGEDATTGGVAFQAGPPKNPNFPWVLLDRAFYHFEHLITRAHGRRDAFVIDFTKLTEDDGERAGRSSRLPAKRRESLAKWFRALTAGRRKEDTSQVFNAIQATLEEIESEIQSR